MRSRPSIFETEKRSVEILLEAKTLYGGSMINKHGNKFEFVKSMGTDNGNQFLIVIKSSHSGVRMIVDIDGKHDENFTIKFN